MLLHHLRAFFLLPITFVVAWKPIVGPPAAFTLKQTLPAVASSVVGNQFLDTQSQAASHPYIDTEERILNGKFSYAANSIFSTGLTEPVVKTLKNTFILLIYSRRFRVTSICSNFLVTSKSPPPINA